MKNKALRLASVVLATIMMLTVFCSNMSLNVNAEKNIEEIVSWSYKQTPKNINNNAIPSANGKGTLTVVGPSSLGRSSEMIGAKGWKVNDYWLFYIDASEYESMTFEFTLRGTKNAPANWELDFSTDNSEWTMIDTISLPFKNGDSIASFYVDSLPQKLNHKTFWLRLKVKDGTVVKDGEVVEKFHAGAYANVNNVVFMGRKAGTDSDVKVCEAVYTDSENGEVLPNEKVHLMCNTEGAVIYFNTDGSENYIPYLRPLEITENTTVKAFAYAEGVKDSDVSEFVFTVAR